MDALQVRRTCGCGRVFIRRQGAVARSGGPHLVVLAAGPAARAHFQAARADIRNPWRPQRETAVVGRVRPLLSTGASPVLERREFPRSVAWRIQTPRGVMWDLEPRGVRSKCKGASCNKLLAVWLVRGIMTPWHGRQTRQRQHGGSAAARHSLFGWVSLRWWPVISIRSQSPCTCQMRPPPSQVLPA
jgi:hypothetical protein